MPDLLSGEGLLQISLFLRLLNCCSFSLSALGCCESSVVLMAKYGFRSSCFLWLSTRADNLVRGGVEDPVLLALMVLWARICSEICNKHFIGVDLRQNQMRTSLTSSWWLLWRVLLQPLTLVVWTVTGRKSLFPLQRDKDTPENSV